MAIYVCRKRGSGNPRVQHKTVDAESSLLVVLPDSGYDVLGSVTINPQTHSDSYTPQPNTASNDMGANHNKRYVNTSGMVVPSGNTDLGTFSSNGTYTNKNVSGKATASFTVNVSNPVLSGDATESDVMNGKTFYSNNYTKKTGTYTPPTPMLYSGEGRALSTTTTFEPEDGFDGFLDFTVKPQVHSIYYDATAGIKPNKVNDMGAYHNYRYVDTTGMITPAETSLWTNPSPTSSMPTGSASDAFVTISEEYIYFDYLKIRYQRATNVDQISEAILPVAYMGDMYTSKCGLIEKDTNGNTFCRLVHNARVTTYKTIAFSTCNRVVSGQTSVPNNAICIPLEIIGIKL